MALHHTVYQRCSCFMNQLGPSDPSVSFVLAAPQSRTNAFGDAAFKAMMENRKEADVLKHELKAHLFILACIVTTPGKRVLSLPLSLTQRSYQSSALSRRRLLRQSDPAGLLCGTSTFPTVCSSLTPALFFPGFICHLVKPQSALFLLTPQPSSPLKSIILTQSPPSVTV